MARCVVCDKRRGKRTCMIFFNKSICPRCCAQERLSPGCDRCRYYQEAVEFKNEKKSQQLLSRLSYLESMVDGIYNLLVREAKDLPRELGDIFSKNQLAALQGMENMGSRKMIDEVDDGINKLVHSEHFDGIVFSEEPVREAMEEEGFECDDMLEYNNMQEDEVERIFEAIKRVVVIQEERERLVLSVLKRMPAIKREMEFSIRLMLFILWYLDGILVVSSEEYIEDEDSSPHPIVIATFYNTCLQIVRRDMIAGRKRRKEGLIVPRRGKMLDYINEVEEGNQDNQEGLILPD